MRCFGYLFLFLTIVFLGRTAQAQIPMSGGAVTLDFNTFRGLGFSPTPTAGMLDSDDIIVRGLDDGDMDFGDTETSGSFARGPSSGDESDGGIWAFLVAPGDFTFGAKPRGDDFAPGEIVIRYINDTGATVISVDFEIETWVFNNRDLSHSFDLYYASGPAADYASQMWIPWNQALFESDATADESPAWVMASGRKPDTGFRPLAPGDYFFLRILCDKLIDSGGRGDEFGLDDVTMFPSVATSSTTSSVTVGDTAGPDNDAGWRQMATPLYDISLGDLAAENLIQGIPGSFPSAAPNIFLEYTSAGGFANPAGTDTSTEPEAGRGFFWYFYDNDAGTSDVLPDLISGTGTERFGDPTTFFSAVNADDFYLAGNPWDDSVLLSEIYAQRGATIADVVFVWDPSGGGSYTMFSRAGGDEVAAWQGFWLGITGASDPVSITTASGSMAAGGIFIGRSGNPSPEIRRIGFELNGIGPAETPARDRAASIVFVEGASVDYDLFDATKPQRPASSFYADLYPMGLRNGNVIRKAQESRPFDVERVTEVPIELEVVGGTGSFVLTWPTLEGIPPEWGLVLVDTQAGTTVDLLAEASYAFVAGEGDPADRFVLTVEPNSTTANEPTDELPAGFELSAVYPNPFNPQARFTLQVAQAQDVTVSVFDLLGRRVMDLHQGALTAGMAHAFTLDGRDLASGFYVVRVSGETFSDSRRVTLLK